MNLLLSLFTFFVSTQGLSNEQILLQHLIYHDMNMHGTAENMNMSMNMKSNIYDKRVRPVIDFHDRVNTSFSLIINSLEFFKQPEEKIRLNVELDLYWKDQFLTWNPDDFGGVSSLNIDPNEIWTPDIELYNSGAFPEIWTKNSESTVNFQGNVFLSIPVLITFSCFLNLDNFPFDTQTCNMEFGSWKFSKKYLDIRVKENKDVINYDNFYHNEWKITSAYGITEDIEYLCCPGDYFPTSTLSIELERKYTKYIIVIIMTVFLTVSSINVLLLSMEKYRRTFILVFIPLTIIWVQLDIASKNPVIENSTKLEDLVMTCYYICILCAFYSGIMFCILNNKLAVLERLGVSRNIGRNYNYKPKGSILTYPYGEHEIVGKKYLGFRKRLKIADNVIKILIVCSFTFTIIGILLR